VALGDEPDARRAFELALAQDSEAHLDPSTSPPEMIGLLAEVRKSLHAELTLLGQGASATLDGANLGPLPLHQQIPIGKHALRVFTADLRLDQKEEFFARPGDSIALTFNAPNASPVAASTLAPPPVGKPADSVSHEAPIETSTGVDLFGHLGVLADPVDRALAFEGGVGMERGLFIGTLSGVWGASGGVAARAGIASPKLLGPLGAYACAEVPVFFSSEVAVGLGAQAGLSWRIGIVEPYAGASFQHFLSGPGASTPRNYLLVPVGARVYLP
jgi:hypothetical protein